MSGKDIKFEWNPLCENNFCLLKNCMASVPVIQYPKANGQYQVETDTSDYVLGAILSICTSDDEIHPVAFHSCTFTGPEINYDTHDKELLAIFDAFKV